MKRLGGVWQQLVSFENLLLAFRKARRCKSRRPSVAGFERNLETEKALMRPSINISNGRIALFVIPYMDSSRFASILPHLDWGTTAHVYPAFNLSDFARAIMGYSRVDSSSACRAQGTPE
jgi:hypothetical protein